MEKIKVIIVTGPTATGKTSLAVKIARFFNGEIISADSRQVYKGLDIGTGKDIEEYGTGKEVVKYHLIDILSPEKEYNLRQFNVDAKNLIYEIRAKNKLPIIAGGTALYIDSLLSNYKFPLSAPDYKLRDALKTKSPQELSEYLKTISPESYKNLDNKNSRPRLLRAIEDGISKKQQLSDKLDASNFEWLILGTFFPRKEVHQRIETRLEQRLKEGMVEEVSSLHRKGISWERLDAFGLEYRYISQYLKDEIEYEEMKATLLAKIRRLARSQDIWFRKMERKGHKIYWITKTDTLEAFTLIRKFQNNKQLPEPEIKLMNINY